MFLSGKVVLTFSYQIQGGCNKSNIRRARKVNPWSGTFFPLFPPSNSLVSFLDPWRTFWTDMAPFKGPRLGPCTAFGTTGKQGYQQVWHARHKGPRTQSRITDAILDFVVAENALLSLFWILGGPWPPLTTPWSNYWNQTKLFFSHRGIGPVVPDVDLALEILYSHSVDVMTVIECTPPSVPLEKLSAYLEASLEGRQASRHHAQVNSRSDH